MKNLILKILKYGFIAIVVFVIGVAIFMNVAPQFGAQPEGKRLEQIQKSPNYRDGRFYNTVETNLGLGFFEGVNVLFRMLFGAGSRGPENPLPVDENTAAADEIADNRPALTWFGHSAFLLEMEGMTILLDPMLGPAAAPVPFFAQRYAYEKSIRVEDLPHIDLVIISHDHYDHLDYPSIKKLKDKTDRFYVPLGVGAHLEHWGIEGERIVEMDWWDTADYKGIRLVAAPARHFSGRGISDGHKTLWASWVIKGDSNSVFFGGDSGYFDGFKTIGEKYGPFDITMLECGQYNHRWPDIHMMPEETVQAHIDLRGKALVPIHWGAFTLSLHDWTEPVERALKAADSYGVTLATPKIGQRFRIGDTPPHRRWWKQ